MPNLLKLIFGAILSLMIIAPFIKTEQSEPFQNEEQLKTSQIAFQEKPNFAAIKIVSEKKKAFFDYVRPAVEFENQRIIEERSNLLKLQKKFNAASFSSEDIAYANRVGRLYLTDVPSSGLSDKWFDSILSKVNVIPEALVLTQAANESAWGTSRFATQANNYFGQWCYRKGCGLIPLQRTEGATHEVAKFNSMLDSVHAYFMNVNRNAAYSELREIRLTIEKKSQNILSNQAAEQLTNGLLKYSERGQAYVDDLQSMIRVNKQYWTSS